MGTAGGGLPEVPCASGAQAITNMHTARLLILLGVVSIAGAQTRPATSSAVVATPQPSTILLLAEQVDRLGITAATDISRLRIDKWKAEGDQKDIARNNADSLQRNLTAALPTLTSAVKSAPNDIAASFKLYRNLNAVYDVMKSLTEGAGAFGKKEEFEVLSQDLATLDGYRRSLADYLEQLAAYKDALSRGAVMSNSNASSTTKSGVKRIVVDDTVPTKKKSSKKK